MFFFFFGKVPHYTKQFTYMKMLDNQSTDRLFNVIDKYFLETNDVRNIHFKAKA